MLFTQLGKAPVDWKSVKGEALFRFPQSRLSQNVSWDFFFTDMTVEASVILQTDGDGPDQTAFTKRVSTKRKDPGS